MSVEKLVCDIIEQEMGLATDQVYLWNQKLTIPADDRIYIAVRVASCKPFGSKREEGVIDGNYSETLTVNMQATLSIDIHGRTPDARDRKEEVLMALKSTYAQSQMELNSFFVAPISTSFVDLSEVEGAAIPYRFNMNVAVQYALLKSKQIAYYDTYSDSVITED